MDDNDEHLWRLVSMTFGDDPVDEYRCELCGRATVDDLEHLTTDPDGSRSPRSPRSLPIAQEALCARASGPSDFPTRRGAPHPQRGRRRRSCAARDGSLREGVES